MYVHPFWIGVLTTITVEVVALLVVAICVGGNNHDS